MRPQATGHTLQATGHRLEATLTSMKARCLSIVSSVVPFLYPSVGRGLAQLGFSKLGEDCPIRGRAAVAAQG